SNQKKLYKVGDAWFACAGNSDDCAAFQAWFINGENQADKPKLTNFAAIVVRNGQAWRYEESLNPFRISHPDAEGSGRPVALGAMGSGATAEEAERIAMRFDVHTGGRVQVSK